MVPLLVSFMACRMWDNCGRGKRFSSVRTSLKATLFGYREWDIGNNDIRDEGVKYMKKFPDLTHLGLSSTKITAAGVEILF